MKYASKEKKEASAPSLFPGTVLKSKYSNTFYLVKTIVPNLSYIYVKNLKIVQETVFETHLQFMPTFVHLIYLSDLKNYDTIGHWNPDSKTITYIS